MAQTNVGGVKHSTLAKDNSAPVLVTGAHSSTLVVTEPAFSAESAFIGTTSWNVIATDINVPVLSTQAAQTTLIVENNGLTSATQVWQQILVVTERPPGAENVNTAAVISSTLIAEAGASVNASTLLHAALIQIEAPTPDGVPNVTSIHSSTLITEPNAPTGVTRVRQSSLVLTEGPILSAEVGGVIHQTIALDLNNGHLFSTTADQLALIITEPKSRDPDRTKVITVAASHRTTFPHPYTLAAKHRTKVLTHFAASPKKFKAPTQVAALHRSRLIVQQMAVRGSYVDPKELISKLRVVTLDQRKAVVKEYSERVVSDTLVPNLVNEIAQHGTFVKPTDLRSNVDVPSLVQAIVMSSKLDDPSSIQSPAQTPAQFMVVSHRIALGNPIDVATEHQIAQHSWLSAHKSVYSQNVQSMTQSYSVAQFSVHGVEYPKDVRSMINLNSVDSRTAMAMSYLSPTDPLYRSQEHINTLKQEVAQTQDFVDPKAIQSSTIVLKLTSERALKKTFNDPSEIQSTTLVPQLLKLLMSSRDQMNDPAGVVPTVQLCGVAIETACSSMEYVNLPRSKDRTIQTMIVTTHSAEFIDPLLAKNTNRSNSIAVLAAIKAVYTNPEESSTTRRRVSSSRVTRKRS